MSTTKSTARRRAAAEPPKTISSSPARPSKLDCMIAMLGRAEGASLAELTDATGWRAHSVRGAIAGALKRKGHRIGSEKVAGERRYRIEAKS